MQTISSMSIVGKASKYASLRRSEAIVELRNRKVPFNASLPQNELISLLEEHDLYKRLKEKYEPEESISLTDFEKTEFETTSLETDA